MQAIYVGMIGQHLANLALLQAPERPEHIALSLHRLHRALTITGFGQLDDVAHKVGRSITEHDVVRTYCLKTGYYTFVNPLQTGALLAGVSDMATEQQITEFGQATGVVFQLHDDYLGVFGEVSATGKPSLDDLKEGKYTLLVYYALEHATPDDAMVLRRILGNVQVTPADLRRAQEIFTDSGATLYTQTEMHEYAAIAQERLASTPIWSEQFKAFLSGLMDYMASRQS
jgi:geranylgeranyl pyrophosphate synthase